MEGVSVADGKTPSTIQTKAKEEFAKAKADLQAQGVEFPIHLDLPTSSTYTEGIKQAQSFKQSVEWLHKPWTRSRRRHGPYPLISKSKQLMTLPWNEPLSGFRCAASIRRKS